MSVQRYHPLLRLIHWFMALTILSLFGLGLYMTGLDKEDPLRATLYGLHKSFGALILCLLIVRVAVRLFTAKPRLPKQLAWWERGLAHITHFALYVLMFQVPMSGFWMSNSWGHGVSMFGLELPRLFPEDRAIAPQASETHEILAFVIIGLVVLHVLGALKHRFMDKHDVLHHMTFGRIPAAAQKADASTVEGA